MVGIVVGVVEVAGAEGVGGLGGARGVGGVGGVGGVDGVGVIGIVGDRVALGLETSRITVLRLHTVWLSGWRPLELVQHVHSILSDTSEASWRFVRDRQG